MDRSVEVTLDLLDRIFPQAEQAGVQFRLWQGSHWPDIADARATIVLNHAGALRRMLLPGTEVGLAEAYLYDDFDIEGEAEAVFALQSSLTEMQNNLMLRLGLGWRLLQLPGNGHKAEPRRGPAQLQGEQHSVERDRQAVTYHYDVSNEFYELWLDERMVYSCGYFHSADDSLDQAQRQKLDHLCRKLRLERGQRLLDIGCGWGGLVIYAAEHYGVQALGITLSEPQAAFARQRIQQAGLEQQCQVEVLDYRELDEPAGFDTLASVGMFEHVGAAKLPAYFEQAYELLRPGGLFLNHGITRRATDPPDPAGSFSDAYVFPDGELTPVSTSLAVAEGVGFEVRDVESLREHYAMTLRHWVHRLEANHQQALAYVDEPTYRVWRLFMSGSADGFSRGRLNLHQALLAKTDDQGRLTLPLTRQDLYRPHLMPQ